MTVVLTGSFPETAKFARAKGLRNIRHIVDRDALAAMNTFMVDVVHVLPSFYDRRDVHTLEDDLKRTDRQFVGFKRIEWTREQLAELYGPPKENFAIDTSPDAVPGQLSIDEALTTAAVAIEVVQDTQLAALKSIAPPAPEPVKAAPKPRKPAAKKAPKTPAQATTTATTPVPVESPVPALSLDDDAAAFLNMLDGAGS